MNPLPDGVLASLETLNPRQRAAATHGESPLLIVAGAGTGKTTTLAHRVLCLTAAGIDPARMLLLTFTRRAAAEMLRRVDHLLEDSGLSRSLSDAGRRLTVSRRLWGGTFHAVATRLLRRHGRQIGLEPEFTILDRGDAEDLMNLLRSEVAPAADGSRFPLKGTCLDIYSRCINTRQPLAEILESAFPWCGEHEEQLKDLFRQYVDRKEEQLLLDYDDLLVFWHALATDEATAGVLRDLFDCVLVDEYQDTNVLQAEILRGMCPDGRGLTVVGDDAQSIYSFRAADVRNILEFPEQYPETEVVLLEQNYRSSQPILDATNLVIGQADADRQHRKTLWSDRKAGSRPVLAHLQDEDEQTDFVVAEILQRREEGVPLKEQAVLFRASHHSLSLEVELTRRNIPFHKYGGLKFVETAHVKDLLAFVRLAENPRDSVAALRVLMLLPGIGRKRAAELLELVDPTGEPFAAWKDWTPPSGCRMEWAGLTGLLTHLTRPEQQSGEPSPQIDLVRRFYAPLLERRYDRAAPRQNDLEQLVHLAGRFPDRGTFLAEMTLDPPSSTQELAGPPVLDEDYLILSTIHSAKGLEWDCVTVLHAADGNIPSDMSTGSPDEIAEELRLFYVALTRARNQLTVCHPQRYYFTHRGRSDRHSWSQLTRFLPADVLATFDQRRPLEEAADGTAGAAGARPPAGRSTAEIRKRLNRMW